MMCTTVFSTTDFSTTDRSAKASSASENGTGDEEYEPSDWTVSGPSIVNTVWRTCRGRSNPGYPGRKEFKQSQALLQYRSNRGRWILERTLNYRQASVMDDQDHWLEIRFGRFYRFNFVPEFILEGTSMVLCKHILAGLLLEIPPPSPAYIIKILLTLLRLPA